MGIIFSCNIREELHDAFLFKKSNSYLKELDNPGKGEYIRTVFLKNHISMYYDHTVQSSG